jgi:hypothetical protein
MASEKRAASENYSQMVVKRPNLGNNNNKALATVNGSSANGTLVQAVSLPTLLIWTCAELLQEWQTDSYGVDTKDKWVAGTCDGIEWSFWRSLLRKV